MMTPLRQAMDLSQSQMTETQYGKHINWQRKVKEAKSLKKRMRQNKKLYIVANIMAFSVKDKLLIEQKRL